MKFRPCIDIHNGAVKQIVGDSVTVKVNDSVSYNVTIKNIENNQDDSTDKIRGY